MSELDYDKAHTKALELRVTPILDLWSVSKHYAWQESPYALFIDLTSIYVNEYGDDFHQYSPKDENYPAIRAFELGFLGPALTLYSERAQAVTDFVLWINEQEQDKENE